MIHLSHFELPSREREYKFIFEQKREELFEEYLDVKMWAGISNVRAYFDFFKKHENEF